MFKSGQHSTDICEIKNASPQYFKKKKNIRTYRIFKRKIVFSYYYVIFVFFKKDLWWPSRDRTKKRGRSLEKFNAKIVTNNMYGITDVNPCK